MTEHLKKKKTFPGKFFPVMNLSCKFGSSSYNILRDRKAFGKTRQTDARTDTGHFIISRTGPIGWREIKRVFRRVACKQQPAY